MIRHSPSLIEMLLSTLEMVERTEGLRPDDPALRQLNWTILRPIAALKADRERRPQLRTRKHKKAPSPCGQWGRNLSGSSENVVHVLVNRKIHRVYLIILPLFIAGQIVISQITCTESWKRFAHVILF